MFHCLHLVLLSACSKAIIHPERSAAGILFRMDNRLFAALLLAGQGRDKRQSVPYLACRLGDEKSLPVY
jgi:hypothetical protein